LQILFIDRKWKADFTKESADRTMTCTLFYALTKPLSMWIIGGAIHNHATFESMFEQFGQIWIFEKS